MWMLHEMDVQVSGQTTIRHMDINISSSTSRSWFSSSTAFCLMDLAINRSWKRSEQTGRAFPMIWIQWPDRLTLVPVSCMSGLIVETWLVVLCMHFPCCDMQMFSEEEKDGRRTKDYCLKKICMFFSSLIVWYKFYRAKRLGRQQQYYRTKEKENISWLCFFTLCVGFSNKWRAKEMGKMFYELV